MEQLTGYEKLKAAVERDCNDRNACGCFNSEGCNVKGQRYLGKGIFIYCKDKLVGETIFMPVAWEKERETA